MIIKSLLSQDYYKFTMNNVFFHLYTGAKAKYRFKCRNNVNLLPFKEEIDDEIDDLCNLRFTQEELSYLDKISYFDAEYIDFLENFQLKRRFIQVGEKDGNLDIVMEGNLTNVMMFEIFVLKIVHDVYSRRVNLPNVELLNEGKHRLNKKIEAFNNFYNQYGFKPSIADFGGRRAYTVDWHEYVVKNLINHNIIIGTSDVDLARRYHIKPIGTMAHEFLTSFQSFENDPMDSQSAALETWLDFYQGELGIALSDTLGDAKFLVDFNKNLALSYDGVRHDSGDPKIWGDMMIAHYEALGIDPKTKTLLFSDGLNFEKVFELCLYFKDKINVPCCIPFGVGTDLSNDVGIPALQNVIKQVEVNGKPVAKLSNNIGKCMCEDQEYLNYLRDCLNKI